MSDTIVLETAGVGIECTPKELVAFIGMLKMPGVNVLHRLLEQVKKVDVDRSIGNHQGADPATCQNANGSYRLAQALSSEMLPYAEAALTEYEEAQKHGGEGTTGD